MKHIATNFSYPFGRKEDFNKDTVELVKQAGITTACVNYGTTLTKYTNPYYLPRVLVRDWDTDVFSFKMREWFDE